MSGQNFRDAELEGWDRKAGYWDDTLGAVTMSAINPLHEAAKPGPGVHILDIACGTGALAAAAAKRGASIIGIDFAPSMIAEAIRRHLVSTSVSETPRQSHFRVPVWIL